MIVVTHCSDKCTCENATTNQTQANQRGNAKKLNGRNGKYSNSSPYFRLSSACRSFDKNRTQLYRWRKNICADGYFHYFRSQNSGRESRQSSENFENMIKTTILRLDIIIITRMKQQQQTPMRHSSNKCDWLQSTLRNWIANYLT